MFRLLAFTSITAALGSVDLALPLAGPVYSLMSVMTSLLAGETPGEERKLLGSGRPQHRLD